MIRTFSENDLFSVMQIWLDTNIKAHSFIPQNSGWQKKSSQLHGFRLMIIGFVFVHPLLILFGASQDSLTYAYPYE